MKFHYFILTLLLVLNSNLSRGQRNNIKLMITPPTFVFGCASLGFEHEITPKSTVDLTFSGFYVPYYGAFSIYPSYRYYFKNDNNNFTNNVFVSFHALFLSDVWVRDSQAPPNQYHSDNLGVGLAVGRKNFFTKKKRLYFDLGFGGSYIFLTKYKEGAMLNKKHNAFLPRIILNIGYQF